MNARILRRRFETYLRCRKGTSLLVGQKASPGPLIVIRVRWQGAPVEIQMTKIRPWLGYRVRGYQRVQSSGY